MITMSYESIHLANLSARGYFVTIFGEGTTPGTLIIDCAVYFTDTHDDGAPSNPLCYEYGSPRRNAQNQCVACEQLPVTTLGSEAREWSPGSVACPLCSAWTAPRFFRERHTRGTFQIVPGQPAVLVQENLPVISETHGFRWMTQQSDEVALISQALRTTATDYFTAAERESFGWNVEAASDTDDDMPPLVPIDDEYSDMPPLARNEYMN